jgi:PadR family transcriptional regulator PadR
VAQPNTDVIQGTLDLLILKTLSLQPLHGFGIARRIEQISRGTKVNHLLLARGVRRRGEFPCARRSAREARGSSGNS